MERVSTFSYHMFVSYSRGLTALRRELAKRKLERIIRSKLRKYRGFEEVDSDGLQVQIVR